jgi:tetratricopeptide (TPR) repeat protein
VKRAIKIGIFVAAVVLVSLAEVETYLTYELIGFIVGKTAFHKGYDAEMRHEYQLAVTRFDAALRNPLGSYWRAYALENRAACLARIKRKEEAIRDYTEALRLKPDLTEAYNYRGYLYAEEGQTDLALRDYNEVIQRDPNMAEVHHARGRIYIQRREYEKALTDFREAIRSLPNYEAAYVESGLASGHLKDRDGALSAFDAALQLAPDDARAYFGRSGVYFGEKDYTRAEADLSNAIRLVPDNIDYLTARAMLYRRLQRPYDEIADLTQALQSHPQNETLLLFRGRAYRLMKDYARAITDFTELIRLTQAGGAYKERARTYFRDGQYALSLADYKQGAVLGGTVHSDVRPLAWLLATCPDPIYRDGLGAIAEAAKDCEQNGNQNSQLLDTLAAAYAEAGQFDQAVHYQRQAVAVHDDKDPEWQTQLETRLELYAHHQPYREEPKR